jgi:hypothetical protein
MLDEREKQPEVDSSSYWEKSQQTTFDFTPAADSFNNSGSESSSSSQSDPANTLGVPNLVDQPTTTTISALRSGRWGNDEKVLFLYGLKRFGKGRWKKMSMYLPHR